MVAVVPCKDIFHVSGYVLACSTLLDEIVLAEIKWAPEEFITASLTTGAHAWFTITNTETSLYLCVQHASSSFLIV